jgi:23S rRNA (adenine2030-N6)-methyltransferase
LNYRHHFHAGNFADVVKHALLVRLIGALQRKEAGFLYLETHAGRGAYDLAAAETGDTHPRSPEHPGGIGRLWGRGDLPPGLAEYVDLVKAFEGRDARPARPGCGEISDLPRTGGPPVPARFYPGSPRLAKLLARPQDRLALCEIHPEEFSGLRAEFAGEPGVSVHERDGYGALSAMLPPPERRALVLIDPSFESREEWAQVGDALRKGLSRFPSGVYAVWYPLTERAASDPFFEDFQARAPAPLLAAEVVVDPANPKMKGCGLAVLNPPWRFEDEAAPILDCLAQALAQQPGGGASLRWIVPRR